MLGLQTPILLFIFPGARKGLIRPQGPLSVTGKMKKPPVGIRDVGKTGCLSVGNVFGGAMVTRESVKRRKSASCGHRACAYGRGGGVEGVGGHTLIFSMG